MTSFSIKNFGCRVNQAEAFDWAEELQERGFRLEKDFERSHVVVVNTCTLTGRADRDARRFIRRILRLNPGAKVVATGCLAERNPAELENIWGVWRVIPNSQKAMLAGYIHLGEDANSEASVVPFRARALVKVQDGCNMSCSFCVIPRVRGRSVSTPRESVLSRVKQLAENGFAEIVLTGIHLCSYGRDLPQRSTLLDLLEDIEALEKAVKVRLSSLDPRLLSPRLLRHVTASKKICPHFHLSLQHGSESVLKRMGRQSTVAEYRDTLAFLREQSPQAGIGADIIVGFPCEAESDFEDTVEFLSEAPLTYFHVFSYSPRPGTDAAGWPQVSESKKKARAARLRRMSCQKNLAFRSRFLGQELEAVVIENNGGTADALTSNYIQVRLSACPVESGRPVLVKLNRVREHETVGEVVTRS
jgi:threonylcarbamoyladenosine tRNA methylthiotransferase MtaB